MSLTAEPSLQSFHLPSLNIRKHTSSSLVPSTPQYYHIDPEEARMTTGFSPSPTQFHTGSSLGLPSFLLFPQLCNCCSLPYPSCGIPLGGGRSFSSSSCQISPAHPSVPSSSSCSWVPEVSLRQFRTPHCLMATSCCSPKLTSLRTVWHSWLPRFCELPPALSPLLLSFKSLP